MNTLLSALPILAVVVSLLAGISALRAAWLGLAATLLAVVLAFPVAPSSIWPAVVRWTPIVLEVLLIIGGGLWMSQVLQHSGAQADLARWIRDRAGPGIGTVLLIVHGITPFAESMTGFGIGITIGIPLLAHAGLPPRRVALIGLLGLSTVPWGSMGPGTLIGANMAGLSFYDLGMGSAHYSVLPFVVTGVVAAWLAAAPHERIRAVLLGTGSGLLLWAVIYLSNWLFGTAPAGALGASVMTVLYLGLGGRGARCAFTVGTPLSGDLCAAAGWCAGCHPVHQGVRSAACVALCGFAGIVAVCGHAVVHGGPAGRAAPAQRLAFMAAGGAGYRAVHSGGDCDGRFRLGGLAGARAG